MPNHDVMYAITSVANKGGIVGPFYVYDCHVMLSC